MPAASPLTEALADLVAATTEPYDRNAAQRWWEHSEAARAEGMCPLEGVPYAQATHPHDRRGRCEPRPQVPVYVRVLVSGDTPATAGGNGG